MNYLWVALGSAIGGVGRYWLAALVDTRTASAFPFGTLTVNVVGSCLIGLLLGLLSRGASSAHAFLIVGVLGGFTTFSAFSHQVLELLRAEAIAPALLYIASSIVLCLLAVYLGHLAAHWVHG